MEAANAAVLSGIPFLINVSATSSIFSPAPGSFFKGLSLLYFSICRKMKFITLETG